MTNEDPGLRADYGWPSCAIELGLALQRMRVARGLSQEELAHRAGISAYTYQKYEKGESRPGTPANPRLSTLLQLAHGFGVPVGELLPPFEAGPPAA